MTQKKTITAGEEVYVSRVVRKALERPIKVMRERQKRIDKGVESLISKTSELKTREDAIKSQAPNVTNPLMAINMLVVEALFLLENRTKIEKPKHYRVIHRALTLVEQFTSADMGRYIGKSLYAPDPIISDVLSRLSKSTGEELSYMLDEDY